MHKAANVPEAKLGGENEPRENPIIPPVNVANVLICGPRRMPIIGAMIAAADIA